MEKTIKISGIDVRLDNNIGWAIAYRDQFGRDIIPALMPMFAAVMDVVAGLFASTGKTENVELDDILALTDGDALINAMVHIGGLEMVDFINLTWSLYPAPVPIGNPKKRIETVEI